MAKPIWEVLIASAGFREVADLTGRSAVLIRHLLQRIPVLKIISKLLQLELYWPISAQSGIIDIVTETFDSVNNFQSDLTN